MKSVLAAFTLVLGSCHSSVTPPSGVEVDALISSVSLADDCPSSSSGAGIAPCAPDVDCPSFCQQSGVQLDFTVGAGSIEPLPFRILEARLLDADTNELVDDLDTREPSTWVDDAYASWDEQLISPSELSTSYKLSAPDWSDIGSRVAAPSDFFILELDVEIDGEPRTLQSDPIAREAPIVT